MRSSHGLITGAALLLLLGSSACGARSQSATDGSDGPGKLVTAEQIRRSGARTAWEAIERTIPHMGFRQDRQGRPAGIVRRGQSSINMSDIPTIILDGTRLVDFSALGTLPAHDVLSLRFMSGLDGTTYYGTNSGDGVIVIRTKSGG